MSKVATWSTTAGNNNSSPPDGWPEGMARSAVNDAAREMMAALAKVYQDRNVTLVTAGGTTAYTLTTNNVYTSLSQIGALVFRMNAANTGAVTLNVDGLGAIAVTKGGGQALVSGDLSANQAVMAVYNGNQNRFEVIGPQIISAAGLLALLLTVDGAGSGLDADLLDGLSSAAFLRVANNLSDVASAATAFSNIKQAASETATGVSELATAAEMVTATDAARIPTALTTRNHPGVAKAWGEVSNNGTATLLAGHNVASVSRTSGGVVDVQISNDLGSANYAVVVTVGNNERICSVSSKTAGSFNVIVEDLGGVNEDENFNFVVFGTLA